MKKIMMLVNVSGLSNHRFRADVRAVGSARRSLWSRRREASTTSRFIDCEFNRPQVPWSSATRIRWSKKERGIDEKKNISLLPIFLKALALRGRNKMSGCSVFDLNRGRKLDARYACKCACACIRVLLISLSFPMLASWFGLYLVDSCTEILWPWTFIAQRKCLFLNSNDTRSCLYAR